MCLHAILKFLDNATVAAVIAVVIGSLVASRAYRKQKDLDRRYLAEDQLMESVLLLKEHCKAVNQNIDRIINTLIQITNEGNEEAMRVFAEVSLPKEAEDMGQILMYQIPEDIGKIESAKLLYFSKNETISNAVQAVFDSFKRWHESTQKYVTGQTGTFDSKKRVADVPELSLKEFDQKIQELGKSLAAQ